MTMRSWKSGFEAMNLKLCASRFSSGHNRAYWSGEDYLGIGQAHSPPSQCDAGKILPITAHMLIAFSPDNQQLARPKSD